MADTDLSTVPTEHLLASLGTPGPSTGIAAPAAAAPQAGHDLSGASTEDLLKALPAGNASTSQFNAPDPTEGMSGWQRFFAGAGKAVADTGRGIGQFLGIVPQSEVDEAAQRDQALMHTGAGVAGNIAGQAAQMAVGGAAVKAVPGVASALADVGPITRAAMAAGTFSAAQPVQSGDTRLGNAAEGAVLGGAGQAIEGGAARLAAGASDTIAPHIKDLYQRAVDAGIPVNAAQLSDSPFLKTVSSQLARLPFTGAAEARQVQQQAFNRAVSHTMGEDADLITPDVYAAAKARIGRDFEGLTARNTMNVDMPLLTRLSGVVDDANRYGAADTSNAVRNLVDNLMSKVDENGTLHGRAYQAMDSQLGQLMKTGGEKAHYLGQVREALRDAMDQNISTADSKAWTTARNQWKALKTVRDLAAKDPSGNISPTQLGGRVGATNAGKEALAEGSAGELGDLAAIGKQFVRDPVPDSGTAQRLLAQAVLTGGVGGGAYAAGGNPTEAAAAAGASLIGGRLLSRALNSPAAARYMVEGAGPIAEAAAGATKALPTVLPAGGNALAQSREGSSPAVKQQRADLIGSFAQARRMQDLAAEARARMDIAAFNRDNPRSMIAPLHLDRATRSAAAGGQSLADGGSVRAGGAHDVDARAHQAATSPRNRGPKPSQAQENAGNFRMGHLRAHGMNVSIESPEGSTRRGVDPDGAPWQSTIVGAHYGRIRGTVGADKDHLDAFVGRVPSKVVHVIDQLTPDGKQFDEHKSFLHVGDSPENAKAIYAANHPPGWKGFGAVSSMPSAAFRAWAKSGKLKEPLAWAPRA